MKKGLTALVLLIFLTSSLSGCLSNNDTVTNANGSDSETNPSQDGGLICIEHDGLERCWEKHVPENLDPGVPVPLIVDVHGYSSTSSTHMDLSGFNEIANTEGAIIVYPNGVPGKNLPTDPDENQAWNAGWCCAHASRDNIDDVGFITRVIEMTIEQENINSSRIYASGWSNGCAMVQRLAMEMSHVLAAVGCMSHYLITDYVDDYSPIPIMEVHGFLDNVVLYETSLLSLPWAEDMWTNPESVDTGAIENMHEWASYNQCTDSMKTFETNEFFTIQGFDECENDAIVRLMTIFAAQHNPYANDNADGSLGTQGFVQTSEHVWDFLIQHSKEEAIDTEAPLSRNRL